MVARPSWTGHFRLSLVTFPVQLYVASKSTRNIPLHMLHEPTGKRVHNQPVVEGIGAIDKDEIVKGYEYKKGKYVVLTPEEVSKVRLPTNKIINIAEFVDVSEIDVIYYNKPYYVVPQNNDIAVEAYSILHAALKDTGKVAIGEVVLSGKEHLVSVRTYGKGLLLETLRYADEVRLAHGVFENLKTKQPDKEQLSLAKQLIKKKTKAFHIEKFDDSYEKALHELIERKLKKLPIEEEEIEDTGNVISLMDALKRSVSAKEKASGKAKKKTKASTKGKKATHKKAAHKKTKRKKAA